VSWLSLAAFLLASGAADTADTSAVAAAPTTTRDEAEAIVVTATRQATRAQDAAGATSVVRVDRADAKPLVDLADVLARVPGVNVQNRQNYAQDTQVSIRGFGSRASFGIRGVKIFVDDIPATIPDGQGQGALIPLSAVERVEVLRGPWSVGYGNAAGGVIAATTFSAINARMVKDHAESAPIGVLQASVNASSSANITQTLQTRVGTSGETVGGWVAVQRFQTDGARPQSRVVRDQTYARMDIAAANNVRMQITANLIEQPETGDPLGLTPADWRANPAQTASVATLFNTRKSIRHQQLGAVTSFPVGGLDAKVIAYGGNRDVVQFLSTPVAAQTAVTSAGGVIDIARAFHGVGLRLAKSEGAWRWTLGVDADRADDVRRGFENFVREGSTTRLGERGRLRRDEDNRQRSNDIFAQTSFALSNALSLNAGVRHSDLRVDVADRFVVAGNGDDSGGLQFRATSPAVGATWRVSEVLSLYTSAARGFETPTVAELAYRADGSSGLNTTLQPAKNRQWEFGANVRAGERGAFTMKTALFGIRTQNEIVQASSVGGRATFQNAAATTRDGVEVSLDWRVNEQLALNAALTHIRARIRDAYVVGAGTAQRRVDAGSVMPAVPRENFSAELVWKPLQRTALERTKPSGLELRGEVNARSRMAADDANTTFAPGFVTVAMSAVYRFRVNPRTFGAQNPELAPEFSLYVRGDNLADRRIVGSVIVNEANQRFFEPALPRRVTVGFNGTIRF
jgi:iron complex outermembrane recepter protein